ncbi:hypothetical protein ACFQ08_41925, partial [Streptosporangium algeriense]
MTALAERWARARTGDDHAGAETLRGEIEAEGWLVRALGEGFDLVPRPYFEVWPTVSSIPVPKKPINPENAEKPGEVGRVTGTVPLEEDTPEAERVEEAAAPGARPERLGDLEAERVAETEAA